MSLKAYVLVDMQLLGGNEIQRELPRGISLSFDTAERYAVSPGRVLEMELSKEEYSLLVKASLVIQDGLEVRVPIRIEHGHNASFLGMFGYKTIASVRYEHDYKLLSGDKFDKAFIPVLPEVEE